MSDTREDWKEYEALQALAKKKLQRILLRFDLQDSLECITRVVFCESAWQLKGTATTREIVTEYNSERFLVWCAGVYRDRFVAYVVTTVNDGDTLFIGNTRHRRSPSEP